MSFRFLLHSVAAVIMLMPGVLHAQQCSSLPAHFEGRLSFRGDSWLIRLHTPGHLDQESEAVAELDIPDMLMAGRPADLRCEAGQPVVTLPFGFGEITFDSGQSDEIRGARSLGGDSLRVRLTPSGPPPYRIEEVRFRNGDVELVGSLYLPPGPGPHPGIVVVHGSGPQGREMLEYRSWGDYFARLGLATLVYDKRGVGASGGDYQRDSAFTALTGDALGAVQLLRDRAEVDPNRVGINGASQAGWIAYRAARDPRVAFLALLVPPSVSVAEQEIIRVRAQLRQEGYSEEAVAQAVAHTRLLLAVAGTGLGWSGLAESTAEIADEPWAESVHRPDALEDLRWWRDHAAVDPRPDLAALRVPLFAVFSAGDPIVPALDNAGPLRDLAARTSGADITVVTVPRGNHRLEIAAGMAPDGRWHLPRISREALASLERWIRWRWLRHNG